MKSIDVNVDSPKYKKKRQSNTSKSDKRSDHKHTYEKIIIIYPLSGSTPVWDKRCPVCGRLGNMSYAARHEGLRKEHGAKIITPECFYSAEELHEKFPDTKIYRRKLNENGYTMWGDIDLELIYPEVTE